MRLAQVFCFYLCSDGDDSRSGNGGGSSTAGNSISFHLICNGCVCVAVWLARNAHLK